MNGLVNELERESMGELAFFIAPIDRTSQALGIPIFARFLEVALPRPSLRAVSSELPPKSESIVIFCKMHFSTFEPAATIFSLWA